MATTTTTAAPSTEPLAEDDHTAPGSPSDRAPSLELELVTACEVSAAISSLKSTAMGANGINARMLKSLLGPLLSFFVALFKLSLSDCWFPVAWKRVIIVPIAKSGIPKSANDYRPIALLKTLSKVLERLVCNRVDCFIKQHSILEPWQCGL